MINLEQVITETLNRNQQKTSITETEKNYAAIIEESALSEEQKTELRNMSFGEIYADLLNDDDLPVDAIFDGIIVELNAIENADIKHLAKIFLMGQLML